MNVQAVFLIIMVRYLKGFSGGDKDVSDLSNRGIYIGWIM